MEESLSFLKMKKAVGFSIVNQFQVLTFFKDRIPPEPPKRNILDQVESEQTGASSHGERNRERDWDSEVNRVTGSSDVQSVSLGVKPKPTRKRVHDVDAGARFRGKFCLCF